MIPDPYVPAPLPPSGQCDEPPPELWCNFLALWEEKAKEIPATPSDDDENKDEIEEQIAAAKVGMSKLIERFVTRPSYGKVVKWVRDMGGLQHALAAVWPDRAKKDIAHFGDLLLSPFSVLAPDLADLYDYRYTARQAYTPEDDAL